MKTNVPAIMAMIATSLFVGCNIAGPAHPERDGRKYLETHGFLRSFVDHVMSGEKLNHSEVLELSKCPSTDVRYLVASNPNLTSDEIDIFIRDKNDFVRSGAACNTSLSSTQIDVLTEDSSHTVYCQLAGNTSLSEEALLSVHKKRNPGILWFAVNPNCPDAIRQEIVNSHDDLAKHWLQVMDGWKRAGVYRQNDHGRWYKPLTGRQ